MTEITREELEKQIKEYLAKGGTIKQVPSGSSNDKRKHKDFSYSKTKNRD